MKLARILLTTVYIALSLSPVKAQQIQANRSINHSAETYEKSLVRFDVKDCVQDLYLLEAVLKDAHPCLYCFIDSTAFHQAFAEAVADLESKKNPLYVSKITENEFLATVRRLIAMVQDGHLYAESHESLVNYVSERGKFFPLGLALQNNKAYIREDYSASLDTLALGSEILAINGIAVEEVLLKMMPLLSADANLTTSRYRQLENVFTFDILYWTLYKPTDTYQITYRAVNGQVYDQEVGAVAGSTINLANSDREADRRLILDEKNATAYLDINTFYNADNKKVNATYNKFLESSFKQMKEQNIKNLIIDLRDNPGGLVHNAYLLFSYISPINVESKVLVKSSQFLKEQKKLSFIEVMLKNFSKKSYVARINRAANGDLVEITSKHHFIKNNDVKFTGNVYILANGATFSAASMLVKLCKDYHVGVITGEENGACQAVSFGDLVGFDLPHTFAKVYISTSIVNREDDLEKHSIQPDIKLDRNIQQDAKGEDSVLKQLFVIVNKTTTTSPIARSEK